MKEYIKSNLLPILIGFCLGLILMQTINTVENIIIKIKLIESK